MPSQVTASSSHVRSQYGILILNHKHRLIRDILKYQPQPNLHGHQVWQSSFMIMEYLEQYPIKAHQQVLDLGCGWGLLSIFCAKHFIADVTSLDADERVFPYLDTHAQVNHVSLRTLHSRFGDVAEDELLTSDIMLGGDICYWDSMVKELQSLIGRALESGVRKIIIADPGRETFVRLYRHCKAEFGAILLPWKLAGRHRQTGYLMVIENPYFLVS